MGPCSNDETLLAQGKAMSDVISSETDCKHESEVNPPSKVCIIGCGPGGMFFLHALATRQRQMEDRGEDTSILPDVTCYEQAAVPCGVWRDHDGDDPKHKMMYNSLWTNGPKECMEFFDYTFDDHFARYKTQEDDEGKIGDEKKSAQAALSPCYLPREHVHSYIMNRVMTQKDIFAEYNVQFNTTVTRVQWDAERQIFYVTTEESSSGGATTNTKEFHRVIWAAGLQGEGFSPPKLVENLDGFQGQIYHSTQFDELESANGGDLKGKRLVLIGDNFSAEDLALQSIKSGAEMVYLMSKSGEGNASYVDAWPYDRAEVLAHQQPLGVTDDGFGIKVAEMTFDEEKYKYELKENAEVSWILENIDAVVFCTGYTPSMKCLDKDLQSPLEHRCETYSMPSGWRMKETALDEVLPGKDIDPHPSIYRYGFHRTDLFRCTHMDIPQMMYLRGWTTFPLLELDVLAWLCLSYVLGDCTSPVDMSKEQKSEENLQMERDLMELPYAREMLDRSYSKKWSEACLAYPDHWINKFYYAEEATMVYQQFLDHECKLLARAMQDGGYPIQFGTYEKLNEMGKKVAIIQAYEDQVRSDILRKESPDYAPWKTFRDLDISAKAKSLFTNSPSIPLWKRWEDFGKEKACHPILG